MKSTAKTIKIGDSAGKMAGVCVETMCVEDIENNICKLFCLEILKDFQICALRDLYQIKRRVVVWQEWKILAFF